MNTNSTPIATVAVIKGQAWARSQDGSMRPLTEGDVLYENEVIITADGSRVDLELPDGSIYPVQGPLLAEVVADEEHSRDDASGEDANSDEEGQENTPEGVGAGDDIVVDYSAPVIERTGSFSDEPSGYIRVAKDQNLAESQFIDGGNSFEMSPVLSVSIVGGYNEGIGGRAGGYDEFLDGRASYNPRIIEPTKAAEEEDAVEELRILPQFEDGDAPVLSNTIPEIGVPDNVKVDEDDLDGGNDNEPPVESTIVSGSLGVIPAGESLDTFFSPANEPPAGLASAGQEVQYYITPDGHSLIGYVGSATGEPDEDQWVFTVVINDPGSDAGAQSYTFTLLDQLDHPDADGENELVLPFTFTVQDESGDEVSSGFNVTVIDDVPAATEGSVTGYVDEDELSDGITDNDTEDTTWDSTAPTGGLGSGSLGDLFTIGADQPGSFAFKETADRDPVRTSGGEDVYSQDRQVFYDYESDKVLYGRTAGGEAIFKIEITDQETGDYEFTLLDQLDHPAPAPGDLGDDQVMELSLTDVVQAFDYDKDPVDAAGTFIIKVEDDIPELTADAASGSAVVSGQVWEDALSSGNGELSDGIGDNDGATEVTTVTGDGQGSNPASLSSLVQSGADEPLTFELITDTSVIATELGALTSRQDGLTYAVTEGTDGGGDYDLLTATSDGSVTGTTREVFTLKVYEDGDWEYHLNDQVDHSGADDDDDLTLSNGQESLNLTGLVTVTDADDDTVNLKGLEGSDELFSISIENDIPELTADAASGSAVVSGQVWEDALSTETGVVRR